MIKKITFKSVRAIFFPAFFIRCQQRFDRIDEKLEEIHAQASKTNGRVTKLEKTVLILVAALTVMLVSRPDGLLTVLKAAATIIR